ncbi:hypothetical protein FRX31_019837 [Thalictrum thalictroides]|uniref:F-box domain-containing protein n=1 Tax=Thalictrum thalictroides TaxID=46969 RepID=A0A7J6VZM8_THATH|nr:hypothetical protein FRX31_019837 [Thalictrum thalictroides]
MHEHETGQTRLEDLVNVTSRELSASKLVKFTSLEEKSLTGTRLSNSRDHNETRAERLSDQMGRGRRRNKLNNPDDRISVMPDEILSFILLLLPIRDTARTSILSRRWRYLWKTSAAYSSSFNLDVVAMRGSAYSDDMFVARKGYKYVDDEELLSIERVKFINWVDQILKLDYSPRMGSFRLRHYFKKNFAHHIDGWINMAISKKVQNFDVDLSQFHRFWSRYPNEKLYTFPDWLFSPETDIDARNITRLEYRGSQANFSLLNATQLSEVIVHLVRDDGSAAISRVVDKLSNQQPKLDTLTLTADMIKRPIHLCQITNLKKLVLVITAYKGTLWGFIPLLHGSPYLHTLEMHWSFLGGKGMQKPCDSPHRYLKNITVSGFKGSTHEVEFTTYLLNNATTLQKFTVFETTKYYSYETGYYDRVVENEKMEEGAMEQLMNVLPPGVEFQLM